MVQASHSRLVPRETMCVALTPAMPEWPLDVLVVAAASTDADCDPKIILWSGVCLMKSGLQVPDLTVVLRTLDDPKCIIRECDIDWEEWCVHSHCQCDCPICACHAWCRRQQDSAVWCHCWPRALPHYTDSKIAFDWRVSHVMKKHYRVIPKIQLHGNNTWRRPKVLALESHVMWPMLTSGRRPCESWAPNAWPTRALCDATLCTQRWPWLLQMSWKSRLVMWWMHTSLLLLLRKCGTFQVQNLELTQGSVPSLHVPCMDYNPQVLPLRPTLLSWLSDQDWHTHQDEPWLWVCDLAAVVKTACQELSFVTRNDVWTWHVSNCEPTPCSLSFQLMTQMRVTP